jgi:hypothetical protein
VSHSCLRSPSAVSSGMAKTKATNPAAIVLSLVKNLCIFDFSFFQLQLDRVRVR